VAFLDGDGRVPWLRVLRPGFRHCFAFAWDEEASRWLMVDASYDAVFVRALRDAGPLWRNLHERNARVLLAQVECRGPKRPRLFATCVTAVAALLGLDAPCAVTPRQLYRTLRARGAIQVMGETDG
jgi:hypothetical protein